MTLEPVVLDTDVASLKGNVATDILSLLAGRVLLITFVTLAELARRMEQRQWGTHRRKRLAH